MTRLKTKSFDESCQCAEKFDSVAEEGADISHYLDGPLRSFITRSRPRLRNQPVSLAIEYLLADIFQQPF
jgi:hypothetical protein